MVALRVLKWIGIPGEVFVVDVMELFRKRYSCRAFRSEPVSSETLMKLIEAARLAPSGRGEQPWEFVLVTDVSLLKNLAKLASTGPFIAQAAACVGVFCKTDATYAIEDGAAATENILLAAAGLGLGACWVAGDKKPYAADVARLLKAPARFKLISLVAVGVPAESGVPERPKRPLKEVLHWQGF